MTRDQALQDYDAFVEDRFSLGTGGIPELPYLALALCGEAGELAEKIKKLHRDNNGDLTPEISLAINKELGDVLFYLTAIAHRVHSSVDGVKIGNVDKLLDRDQNGTRRGSGDDR